MEQATDGAETAAIDGLVSSWSENISVSFRLRAPRYGLTLMRPGSSSRGAVQVPQLQYYCFVRRCNVSFRLSRTVNFVSLTSRRKYPNRHRRRRRRYHSGEYFTTFRQIQFSLSSTTKHWCTATLVGAQVCRSTWWGCTRTCWSWYGAEWLATILSTDSMPPAGRRLTSC